MMQEKIGLLAIKKKRICRMCKNRKALIRKYNLYVCRRCFKDIAEKLGEMAI